MDIWKKVVPGKGNILAHSENSTEPMWLGRVGEKERGLGRERRGLGRLQKGGLGLLL